MLLHPQPTSHPPRWFTRSLRVHIRRGRGNLAVGDFETAGDVADLFNFCMVGHTEGDGIISDGNLSLSIFALDITSFTEFDILIGTTAESLSDKSYRSSKSVALECVLFRHEDLEAIEGAEEEVIVIVGEAGR